LLYADTSERFLTNDAYGRKTIRRNSQQKRLGFIKLFYHNRALEWMNIRRIFQDLLIQFHFSQLYPLLEDITFCWSYVETLASVFYKPATVFKKFSFVHLLDETALCACTTTSRLLRLYDPLMALETSSFAKSSLHVRTMDIGIIQHKDMKFVLGQGLNHNPLQPTAIVPAIAIIMNAFQQLSEILDLEQLGFPVNIAREQLHATCLSILKDSMHHNKFKFRYSGRFLLDLPPIKNEIAWLLQHLFCSGLDKASNNVCLMRIKHICSQALERLTGSDFIPCKKT
jgi:hypothetical protein